MKAQDLRIGNLVYDRDGKTATIDSIGMFGNVRLTTSDYHCESSTLFDCDPIQLTEEWLLRFGFEKVNHYFQINEFWVYFRLRDYKYVFRHCVKTFEIKYVHQLQNLYYALTGEELTLK